MRDHFQDSGARRASAAARQRADAALSTQRAAAAAPATAPATTADRELFRDRGGADGSSNGALHFAQPRQYVARYPENFPFRAKCLHLYQRIDGADVLVYAMYTQEFDGDCPPPNRGTVYVLLPRCYHTFGVLICIRIL